MQLQNLDFILKKAFPPSGLDVDKVGIRLDLDGRESDLVQVSGFDLNDFLASQREITWKGSILSTILL